MLHFSQMLTVRLWLYCTLVLLQQLATALHKQTVFNVISVRVHSCQHILQCLTMRFSIRVPA